MHEIKDKGTCEGLYGAGAWRSDGQGTCATCHDVHNSLFVSTQEEKAMRKTCEDCHSNTDYAAAVPQATQMNVKIMNHMGASTGQIGTPYDKGAYPEGACAVCHMATQAIANGDQNSMAVHLWRINSDVSYTTFPDAATFNAADSTKNRNALTSAETYSNDTLTYTGAVWVDLDLACGQCHGGSLGTGATHNGAPYYTKAQLAAFAPTMHPEVQFENTTPPTTPPVAGHTAPTITGYTVSFTDTSTVSSTGGDASQSVSVNWGDGTVVKGALGATFTHTYPTGVLRSYYIAQVVTDPVTSTLKSTVNSIKVNIPQRY